MLKNQKKKIILNKTQLILTSSLKKQFLIKSYKKSKNLPNKKQIFFSLIEKTLINKSICLYSGKRKAIFKQYKLHRNFINKLIQFNNLQNISLNAR